MNICVFGEYKVTVKGRYSYQNEDGDFRTEEVNAEFTLDGGRLLDKVAKEISDHTIIDFDVKDNKLYFEQFNPLNGEGSDYEWTIEEVHDEKRND